jgi:hypothetical protein
MSVRCGLTRAQVHPPEDPADREAAVSDNVTRDTRHGPVGSSSARSHAIFTDGPLGKRTRSARANSSSCCSTTWGKAPPHEEGAYTLRSWRALRWYSTVQARRVRTLIGVRVDSQCYLYESGRLCILRGAAVLGCSVGRYLQHEADSFVIMLRTW